MGGLARLERSVQGSVLTAQTAGFDEVRRIFNVGAQSMPRVIVQCAAAADVAAALGFARDEALPVAVRAGGNSVGGHCLVRDGVVIDLRRLNHLAVEPANRTVTVGAGCLWSDLLGALGSTHGTPGAFDPRVGVAGLTLGGGYGMLSRLHGLAADNLLDLDVILADGTSVAAAQEPELLWAMRGAGANFGVATSLRFRIHPLRPLRVARVHYPRHRLRELLFFYREQVARLPDEASVYLGIGETVDLYGFYFGEPSSGARLLARIGEAGGATASVIEPRGYSQAHLANTETFPADHHHVWRSHFFGELTDGVLETIVAHPAHPASWIVLEHLGGAIGRPAPDATAFPHRAAKFGFVSALKWRRNAPRPAEALQAQQALHDSLRPHSLGANVNYLADADPAAAFGANLPRLLEAKRRYDPTHVFGRTLAPAEGLGQRAATSSGRPA